ncbi:MAG: DUF4145 domain-containing protein [Gammaproteobacteria bacterium]|nr:DUF4145 domain-containing protein [Gammaproteobacteria bacterium]
MTQQAPRYRPTLRAKFQAVIAGEIRLDRPDLQYGASRINNLSLSRCYVCAKFAVWVHDKLIFPPERQALPANDDLPEDVRRDYDEASRILNVSPRGAAALLRLAIQKICKLLGETGDNINDDIASLVAKGLSPLVQKSLDIVRVVGNEAVHPGVIDLNDDRETATKLFDLVNLIADQMITTPKKVGVLYESLPVAKKEAITQRDAKTLRSHSDWKTPAVTPPSLPSTDSDAGRAGATRHPSISAASFLHARSD